jgi:hypothetical protein
VQTPQQDGQPPGDDQQFAMLRQRLATVEESAHIPQLLLGLLAQSTSGDRRVIAAQPLGCGMVRLDRASIHLYPRFAGLLDPA